MRPRHFGGGGHSAAARRSPRPRTREITVEALDPAGNPFSLTAEDMLARVILHECEHLDGQVFLRKLSPLKRELVKKQIRKRIKSGDWSNAVAR